MGSLSWRFRDSWQGHWEGHFGSPSEADLGLCILLASKIGSDAEHVDQLFRKLGLYRKKWAGKTTGIARIEAAFQILEERQADATTSEPSSAVLFSQLAEELELWHTPNSEAFVTIEIDGHQEHRLIESGDFKTWLNHRFSKELGRAPKQQWVQDVVENLRAGALFDGAEHEVYLRVGESGGSIFLDLCNDQWEAVEINRLGWKVISDPPVKFRRNRALRSLPHPAPGDLEALRPFTNIGSDDDWRLLVVLFVQALWPRGPYPVLQIFGEQGSAKSTLVNAVVSLIDQKRVTALPAQGRTRPGDSGQ